MIDEKMIEEIIREVLKEVNAAGVTAKEKPIMQKGKNFDPKSDYPIGEKRKDLIKTSTGKSMDDITLEQVMKGNVSSDDFRITAETLLLQAQVAEAAGRKQFAGNLRRAAELTKVPDERILEIYTALRPYRSSKQELLDIAEELDKKYNASVCAALVREAADVYEKRKRLKGME